MKHKLKKWAKAAGFTVYNQCAYGNMGGYLFSVYQKEYEYNLSVMTGFPDEDTRYRVNQILHDPNMINDFSIIRVEVGDTHITFAFSRSGKGFKKMKKFIIWLMPVLRRNGMLDESCCGLCHHKLEGHPSLRIMKNKRVMRAHEICFHEAVNACAGEKESVKKERGYFFGFLCAAAGAFVGSLPSMIWSIFAPVLGIFSMVSVYGAFKGYEMSGAKRGKRAGLMLVLATLIVYSAVLAELCFLRYAAGKGSFYQIIYSMYTSIIFLIVTFLYMIRDIVDVKKDDDKFIIVK